MGLSDDDKQVGTANLSAKQAVEAVVNSVLSEALSNVAIGHKPAVEVVTLLFSHTGVKKFGITDF